MAQPYFGNTTPSVDYGGMQQAMSMGLPYQSPNTQGPLSTQNWVKNDMLPPQYAIQDAYGKMALQNNQVANIPIANQLQLQMLSHQFGENRMQPLQQQMLRQQIQGEQQKNQFTTPEAFHQALQQDLATQGKFIQDSYGVNVGEAASELHQIPVTDATGKQTMAQAGYDPNTETLYVPPKTVMNPMLGIPTAMPAQQIKLPLGVHLFAKDVGAQQAGFRNYSDMAQQATVQNLQASQQLLAQRKATEQASYGAANPYGSTSPDIVSNGAPTLPGSPPSSLNPQQFAARQAQLQQQTSQEFNRYSGTAPQQPTAPPAAAPYNPVSATGPWGDFVGSPDKMLGSVFNTAQAAYRPIAQLAWQQGQQKPSDDSFQPVVQNRFAQLNALNNPGAGDAVKNYMVNGLLPATSNAVQALGARLQTAPTGIMGWLNGLGNGSGGEYVPDTSGVSVPNYHGALGGGL